MENLNKNKPSKDKMLRFMESYSRFSLKDGEFDDQSKSQNKPQSEEEYGKEMFEVYGKIFRSKQPIGQTKLLPRATIYRSDLPVAAGDPEMLCDINWSVLQKHEFSDELSIISQETSKGYALRLESAFPYLFKVVFYNQCNKELYSSSISQEIPSIEEYIPIDAIENWAYLQLIEEPTIAS